jgi:hypothetical protein
MLSQYDDITLVGADDVTLVGNDYLIPEMDPRYLSGPEEDTGLSPTSAAVVGAGITALLSGASFGVGLAAYKRTDSPMWAGLAFGAGTILTGMALTLFTRMWAERKLDAVEILPAT